MLCRLRGLLMLAVLVAAVGTASTARGDAGVLPDTPEPSWSNSEHDTALERLASDIASAIAERPVRGYCNGSGEWGALGSSVGFDPSLVWGFVVPPQFWLPHLGTWADSSTHTQLSPITCERLWLYGKASIKPTKCAASRSVTETVSVKVRYQATVKVRVSKRVKVDGKWVLRREWTSRRVWRTRTESRDAVRSVAVDPVPCYGNSDPEVTVSLPTGGWDRYAEFALAIQTLAHESVHLYSFTAGRPVLTSRHEEESRADCWGMQLMPRVATALGASSDDATALARWYAEVFYPRQQTAAPEYWSPECRSGGALDLTPADGIWP
jgi:hypothetical protein